MKVLYNEFFKINEIKEWKKLQQCGRVIVTMDCKNCQTKHYKGYAGCKSNWCYNCIYKKRLMWIARLMPILEKYEQTEHNIIKMNLTVQNTKTLKEGLDNLNEAWRNLTNGNGSRKIWKERMIGGLRSQEITVGMTEKKWHPHIHSIIITPKQYNKDIKWLLPRWKELTNPLCGKCTKLKKWQNGEEKNEEINKLCFECDNNKGSVWIKQINKKEKWREIMETIKYMVKPEKDILKGDALKEAYNLLKDKRLQNTWGVLRGLNKQIENDVDLEQKKLTELESFVCQLCKCTIGELHTYNYNKMKNEMIVDLK